MINSIAANLLHLLISINKVYARRGKLIFFVMIDPRCPLIIMKNKVYVQYYSRLV